MKKLIGILLLAAMLLALTACGAAGKGDGDAAKKLEEGLASAVTVTPAQPAEEQPAPTEEEPAPAEEEPAPAEEEPAPAEEEPVPAEEQPAPAEEEPDAEEFIGKKDGNSYGNKALGIRAEFPDTWQVLDDEQTAQVLGIVADSFSETDLADQLRNSGILYDLYALALDQSGDNVNVVIQDLGVLYGIVLDEEKYLDQCEEEIKTTLTQMGITDVRTERQSYVFAGQERSSFLVTAEYNGVAIYERLVVMKAGRYMSGVTAFSLSEGRLDEILGFFSAYGE